MAEYFAGGHLRFLDGEWRDDNGDGVDIAKVVRCENCRYSNPTSVVEGCYCCKLVSGLPQFVKPNEFCSRGSVEDTQ